MARDPAAAAMMPPLRIRVIVESFEGAELRSYVFDINDYKERRVFAEQMTNAYLAGQLVTTYAEDWTPDAKLIAFMAQRWLKDDEP